MKTVGYLGPKGTFTEMAVKAMFPSYNRQPYSTIPKCMDGVTNKEVSLAVVPLENAIEGSVNLTLDYLIHKQNLPIVGEIAVPIEQHLLVHSSHASAWTNVEKVFSHPHAIAQCHEFLRNTLPNVDLQYSNSTGAAAEWLMKNPEKPVAAIGNELAAKEYGLSIVERDIHDFDNNRTRFVILQNGDEQEEITSSLLVSEKTTFMITLPSDYSGALHQVLSAFSWRKLNLSKIESRPMKTGLGNYFFVIDVEQRMDEILIPGVVEELKALGCGVRVLGSYPCFAISKVSAN
ncbi:prephenate dehydratase [Bacillus sp. FJAT-45350]|uniref:prephenate dehydratase n=1 Tax=Bacillus sp. FJAT-45350 TaxID=2011014 RepID=UPI000BB678CB|nr:prephenate dehydratase [Bacillus sp. FJAT-45350]